MSHKLRSYLYLAEGKNQQQATAVILVKKAKKKNVKVFKGATCKYC